jgi:hypothetical protein
MSRDQNQGTEGETVGPLRKSSEEKEILVVHPGSYLTSSAAVRPEWKGPEMGQECGVCMGRSLNARLEAKDASVASARRVGSTWLLGVIILRAPPVAQIAAPTQARPVRPPLVTWRTSSRTDRSNPVD